MKEKIKEALVNATDEIFLDWQIKLHVISGDVDPIATLYFNDLIDRLANQMVLILDQQPKLGVVKLEMLDGSLVDLANVDMNCDIIMKLAEVEEYLREKELIQ